MTPHNPARPHARMPVFMILLTGLLGLTCGLSAQVADPSISASANTPRSEGERLITPEFIDIFRSEGSTGSPNLEEYDVAGFERVYRIETPFGGFKTWHKDFPGDVRTFSPKPEYTLEETYKTRIGGFNREQFYGPDQIGHILSENGVHFTNGTGNGLLEALMITRKYGLQYFFYAPDLSETFSVPAEGSESIDGAILPRTGTRRERHLPYVKEDMPAYAAAYRKELEYMNKVLEDFTKLFADEGGLIDPNFKEDESYFWALFTQGDLKPADFFLRNAATDYERVNAEFKSKYGFDLPLFSDITTPVQKAQRIKLWRWIRAKFTGIAHLRADLFREIVSGKGIIASNVHFAEILDYERYGEAFDYPGVAIRPMLSDNVLAWEYLMGFGTRLVADLTGKVPMISARINIPGSGARIVPTAATIEFWHSQAIQNGTLGFYLWMNDYPSYKGAYRGPFMGNPDPSTRPHERWATSLEIAKKLSHTNVFVPPPSETAILVSTDSNAVGEYGWRRTFSAYIELTKAGVWSNFISDQELWEGTRSLSDYKTIYLPFMDFAESKVVDQLMEYVRNGGTLISCDPRVFEYDMDGKPASARRTELFGVRGAVERRRAGASPMRAAYDGLTIRPYGPTNYGLEIGRGVTVLAAYEDGTPAVVENRYGRGRAILFGNPIADIYLYGNNDGFVENADRSAFYKAMEVASGVEDRSWVWDVNFHNVDQITGMDVKPRPAPLESIQFKGYLERDGGGPPTTMVTADGPLDESSE